MSGHDSTGSYHRSIANDGPLQNRASCADEYIVAYMNRFGSHGIPAAKGNFMHVRIADEAPRPDQGAAADGDPARADETRRRDS